MVARLVPKKVPLLLRPKLPLLKVKKLPLLLVAKKLLPLRRLLVKLLPLLKKLLLLRLSNQLRVPRLSAKQERIETCERSFTGFFVPVFSIVFPLCPFAAAFAKDFVCKVAVH